MQDAIDLDKVPDSEILKLYEALEVGYPAPVVEWTPFRRKPQEAAYYCQADELYYGGAAGGGKTDVLIGLALTEHQRSIIFRREYPQLRAIIDRIHELVRDKGSFNSQSHIWTINDGRVIELGGVQHEWDVDRYQGRPHDLVCFDELPQFSQKQYRFLVGWNRTTLPEQRCRIVAAGNPPLSPEGRWVVEEWAPWLDDKYPNPAAPGELRWYAMLPDEHSGRRLTWLENGSPIACGNEVIQPRSRTFIPARVDDNPILLAKGYKSVLQSFPEPLRSQLLYGDMHAGTEDDPWQVIPTEWVRAAMRRWTPDGAGDKKLSCIGVDVARGGNDKTVLAPRYGCWFGPLEKHPGSATPDGPAVVELIRRRLAGAIAAVNIDVIGVGASVYDLCVQQNVNAFAFNSATKVENTDKTGKLTFRNLRAYAYWKMRELLDPTSEPQLALPPDNELLADLTAPRWQHGVSGVQIEDKEWIIKRIGRSPDCGDAIVQSIIVLQPESAAPRPKRLVV